MAGTTAMPSILVFEARANEIYVWFYEYHLKIISGEEADGVRLT
jgi:hypothetical protein